ncbi:MAG: hypothetical protein IAF02_22510 [Anaerolineae bacterium]|nr:hypothetical protein [Anaerolineae bacterium]
MAQTTDWQLILQTSKQHVGQLSTRALLVGVGIGSLFLLVGVSMALFSGSVMVMLLSPLCLGAGFLLALVGIIRAWQIRGWPLLLVTAEVVERHQATYRGVRHYVRIRVLQAETFHLNGQHAAAELATNELDYMTSPALFARLQEGKTVTLICAPRLHEIVAQVGSVQ